MIANAFYLHLNLIFRLTLFYILAREVYRLLTSYGIPLCNEYIKEEEKKELELISMRDTLRSARLTAEKTLIAQSAIIAATEEQIESWHAKTMHEQALEKQKQALFFEQLKIDQKKRIEHFQNLSIQKKLLARALQDTLQELPSMVSEQSAQACIEKIVTNLAQKGRT